MSKHSSTWETLSLNQYFPPLAYVAKKELLKIPFFGWGFALASPITIDRKAGTDAMDEIVGAGPRTLRARFLDRLLSGRNAHPRRHAGQVQDGRHPARHRDERPRHSSCAQRRLPVAKGGLFGKRPGTITMTIGKPISPTGKDPLSLMQEVEAWVEGEVARLGVPQ